MGKSNVAEVQLKWRGLKYRARLLLDYMALVSIDEDRIPVDVRSWVERAEFLLGGDPIPSPGLGKESELRRKRAWQAQADAVKELADAGAIVAVVAVENKSGRVRDGFAINVLGPSKVEDFSKKILDARPGKFWSVSKENLDALQGNPRSRTQQAPQDATSGTTTHPGDRGTDRGREPEPDGMNDVDSGLRVRASQRHAFVGDEHGLSCSVCQLPVANAVHVDGYLQGAG